MGDVIYLYPPDPDEDPKDDIEQEPEKPGWFWFCIGVLLGLT